MNDWNGDGVLSGNEVRPSARRPDGAGNRDQAGTSGYSPFDEWTAARFTELDRDRDGRIVRNEWQYDRDSFDRADVNRNGIITRREFLNTSQVGGSPVAYDDWTGGGFNNIDRNRDNRITRDEWRHDRTTFDRVDANRDGVLTRREFVAVSPMVGTSGTLEFNDWTEARFNQIDLNRDNRIARAEWQFDRDSFLRADANGDSIITRSEFLGLERSGASDPGAYGLAEAFDRLDRDNDGWVRRAEWAGTRSAFDALDQNTDGVLNRDEFSRNVTPLKQSAAYQLGYERGLTEGRAAGREDKQRNQGWDLDGQRELETADSGYEPRFGARVEYQEGYRAGFRHAYPQGWNAQ